MGLSKASGGMGFRDFHSFNLALLAKQCWRLWNQPDSLVGQIMRAKYYPDCDILEARVGKRLLLLGGIYIAIVLFSRRAWFGGWAMA